MTGTRALLVDLDGTLVDTASANYLAYAEALGEVGVSISREAFDRVAFGRNWRQFLPALLADRAGVEPAAVAARKVALYPGKIEHTRVNEALVSLLASLRPTWRTALVTTASAANAGAILHHYELHALFDTIVTGSDVARHKPNPEAYVLAAERLGVAAADCLIVEDSEIGLASARAFGAPCLMVAFPAVPANAA
jgi:HAD superfamily hydrolase (TIGR01509 family)